MSQDTPPPPYDAGDRPVPGLPEDLPAKVDPELGARLAAEPGQTQRVAAWFTVVPADRELDALGLMGTGANPAVGLLTREQVQTLASRADVERVVLRPTPHTS